MPRPKTDSVRVNIYLPSQFLTALKRLAAKQSTSYSELVRTAVKEYLIRERDRLKAQQNEALGVAGSGRSPDSKAD